MAVSEADVYQRIIQRTTLYIWIIAGVGSVAAAVAKGPRFGLGFLLGASLSYISFWRWKAVVDSLGGAPQRRSIWLSLLRFAVLIGAAYAIVKYLEVTPVAVFFGLLVSAAAVILSACTNIKSG